MRQAHQQKPIEHAPPDIERVSAEPVLIGDTVNRPLFPLSPRERGTDSTGDPPTRLRRDGRGAHGLLRPSITAIAPAIASVVGAEEPMSQTEPVINVTIGRIEVRATVAPQKAMPKSENRPPVMGLDEYLRRRSGGHD